MGVELTTGYRMQLAAGTYPEDNIPGYWESRYGTFDYPIIIQSADGRGMAVITANVNVYDTHYIYFLDLDLVVGTDAFHCEFCDHLLIRGVTMVGADPESYNAQETLKINQSQYIYIEDNDISGAWNPAIDFVSVQYGQVLRNRVHNAGDWCMYVKGGSAYIRVEGNEFFDCGVGGFSAGQGTGFQYMTPPWIQYEAYNIQVVNNIMHDLEGAGVGVQGGYNILVAHNTMWRIGARSHVLEFDFGSRSCDWGDSSRDRCDEYNQLGGWGNSLPADGENYVRIPNRNVYVYNNLIYNPMPFRSEYQHLVVFAPYDGVYQTDSNAPSPAYADTNLQIRGNIIWNGSPEHLLGIEYDAGCADTNPTCNAAQLRAENAINTVEPQLVDPANGDFRLAQPLPGIAYLIPPFANDDLPANVPPGDGTNAVPFDFAGRPRDANAPVVGAYSGD